jgi:hypothetical protein
MLPLFGTSADIRSLTLLVCGLLGVASLGKVCKTPGQTCLSAEGS